MSAKQLIIDMAGREERVQALKSTDSITNFHVVSHTHWDRCVLHTHPCPHMFDPLHCFGFREWYLPFEEFRHLLVDLMDEVLQQFEVNPLFQHFYTDGQMVVKILSPHSHQPSFHRCRWKTTCRLGHT